MEIYWQSLFAGVASPRFTCKCMADDICWNFFKIYLSFWSFAKVLWKWESWWCCIGNKRLYKQRKMTCRNSGATMNLLTNDRAKGDSLFSLSTLSIFLYFIIRWAYLVVIPFLFYGGFPILELYIILFLAIYRLFCSRCDRSFYVSKQG